MNPITTFLIENIIAVFFFYGLAFFVMGLVLALVSRQISEIKFVQAIRPLAAFGLLHGIHEWFEMFQKLAMLTSGHIPTTLEEVGRLTLLGISFIFLFIFGVVLLNSDEMKNWRNYRFLLGLVGVWGLGLLIANVTFRPTVNDLIPIADVLIRYTLAIPGALLGAWALMAQQRAFREHDMSQFGRDLVWCATALFAYGVIGQLFVQQTTLFPSSIINSTLFLRWFGIPVQLFRGIMAVLTTIFAIRALRAVEFENQRRLEKANQARLVTQTAALEAERSTSQQMEQLNDELRLTTHELSLLLDLSNVLATPLSLQDRLCNVLEKIVDSFDFVNAGLILLSKRETGLEDVLISTGFANTGDSSEINPRYSLAVELGEQCIARRVAMCRHLDGEVIEFHMEEALTRRDCQQHTVPMTMIGLPLTIQKQVIGSLVLAQPREQERRLEFDEFKLVLGIIQQLGLSIENALLNQAAQHREKMLSELLHQVVGAQEAERQRIARELHDVTGQSLTAITLGLRGVEKMLAVEKPELTSQIKQLKLFGTNALSELRQFIADLRPPQLDDLGLVAALQWYIQAFEERHTIQVDFVVEGEQTRLPSEYETVLFRIAQEALINIAKHARASQAAVRLDIHPAQICVVIRDDGCGFNPEEVLGGEVTYSGWGLLGIRERTLLLGGQVEIDSTPGTGTQVYVCIPMRMELNNVEVTAVTG